MPIQLIPRHAYPGHIWNRRLFDWKARDMIKSTIAAKPKEQSNKKRRKRKRRH